MANHPSPSFVLPLFHFFLAAVCLWNILFVPDRAGLPFDTVAQGGEIHITNVSDETRNADVRTGDRLVFWKVVRIGSVEHLELLADLSAIGETVRLQVERDNELLFRTIRLVPFYATHRFAVVTAVAGMSILLIGLFVYLKRPDDPAALLLHWSLVSLATVTMMTQGSVTQGDLFSEFRRILLFLSYNMTAACFLLFTLRFPRRLLTRYRFLDSAIIGAFGILSIALSWRHILAMRSLDARVFDSFKLLYDIFHGAFLITLVLGLVIMYAGYARERIPARQHALRWILYGILIGSTPFLFLVVLPQLWGPDLLAPEELAVFFTIAIPLSLMVAFLRYHVFSIQIQHRQRFTTRLLALTFSMLQILFGMIVLSLFWEDVLFGSHVIETLAFGLLIVALSPVRTHLATMIDEAVFPARFNPARLLQDASSRFTGLLVPSEVGPAVIRELHHVIPRFTFLWYRWTGRSMVGQDTTDPGFLPTLSLSPMIADDIHRARPIIGQNTIHHPEIRIDPNHHHWLQEPRLSAALPFHDEAGTILGLLCLQKHDGADPLDRGEYELIRTLCSHAMSVLEHLLLQERMILERKKRNELEELSRLKSHFVSSVSHDLRTPLTSQAMFLDMLDQPRLPVKKRKEYLGFIRQEAGRLRRLVENVLDFSRAESGIREFNMEQTDMVSVLRAATDAMRGLFAAGGGRYKVSIPASLPQINADGDALERAFVNLLSNAYKYTPEKKQVSCVARKERSMIRVDISDNGFGIPDKDEQKIFDPFYRVRDPVTAPTGGVGLGLSLVKRTVEFHGGTVTVHSRRSGGTVMTVRLPIIHHHRGA